MEREDDVFGSVSNILLLNC